MDVYHLVYRIFKSYFPDIPSKKVADPAPRKNPAGPLGTDHQKKLFSPI